MLSTDTEVTISDHQQSWGYEDGPWKGPGPPLLMVADFAIIVRGNHDIRPGEYRLEGCIDDDCSKKSQGG